MATFMQIVVLENVCDSVLGTGSGQIDFALISGGTFAMGSPTTLEDMRPMRSSTLKPSPMIIT